MREILFRGKQVDNGEWVEGDFCHPCNIVFEAMGYDEVLGQKDVPVINDYAVIPETVGQYTGLTDKNGTKIFEGDIAQYTDEEGYYPEDCCDFVGKIVLEHGAFGIATNDNIPIDLDNWCDNDNFVSLWELYWNLEPEGEMLSSIEVIGNIHDNPELLRGGAE